MMKQCPNCGEMNGQGNSTCFRCGRALAPTTPYRKVCPRCGQVYSSKANTCETCGGTLSVQYSPNSSTTQGGSESAETLRWWMILVAILSPVLSILVGYGIRSTYDDEVGGKLIRLSLTIIGVCFGLGILLGGCSALFG